jgi:hypothetical protein
MAWMRVSIASSSMGARPSAVTADDELLGVVLAQASGAHLAVEVVHRPLELRPDRLAEV